jgi:glyoxylase-like metal-dependent hydrolase (beta-lactamase superfamily II)
VGDVGLVRVPYIDVLIDAAAVTLTADEVAAEAWAAPTWAEGEQVRVGAAAWVIESQGRRIVVDPAQAADDILRAGPDAAVHQQAFADALAAAGYPRESIDTVIATHIDGIGMMAWREGDEWRPFFPNAELLMSRREHDAIADEGPYEPSGAEAYLALHEQGVVTTVDDEHAVTAQVLMHWTGGHSPGHMTVNISSGGATATMLGHLALSPLHLTTGENGGHVDPVAARAALRALADGRILIGPLWPEPGAVRWSGDQVSAAAVG